MSRCAGSYVYVAAAGRSVVCPACAAILHATPRRDGLAAVPRHEPKTTAHTCNNGRGPVFGRKTAGCPRCDELLAGASPVQWASTKRRADEAARIAAIRAHNCKTAGCGPVCTFGDW